MLLRIGDATGIAVGCVFHRYYVELDNAYDRGQVTEIGSTVIVDFGDTIVEYAAADIAYVVNSSSQAEHYMACCSGKLISDFRMDPDVILNIEGFEDLLNKLDNL